MSDIEQGRRKVRRLPMSKLGSCRAQSGAAGLRFAAPRAVSV